MWVSVSTSTSGCAWTCLDVSDPCMSQTASMNQDESGMPDCGGFMPFKHAWVWEWAHERGRECFSGSVRGFFLTCRCNLKTRRIAHGGLRLQSVPAISFRSPYISSSHLPECIPYVGLAVLVVVQLFDGKGRTFARENPKSSANSSAIAELHLTNKKDKRATSSHGWLWCWCGTMLPC